MVSTFELTASAIPTALYDSTNSILLTGILRGIEKECLRVDPAGKLAQTPHPPALGAALTHPQITTDFSEALLEFITPPSHRIDTLMQQLRGLHQYTYQNLDPDEMLWCNSMPCMVGNPETIPVAQYGTSNRGKMKSIYRVGLGHRYGRVMQTVAGVHYNFSLPKSFWAFMQQNENSPEELADYRTRKYFDLIRNFKRHYWLLIYLFGASPAMCKSFVKGRSHQLEVFGDDPHTLHLPYATSLRMGDLGYQSAAQEQLYICYDSLTNYIRTLGSAIATPYQPYQDLGLLDANGEYRQLNTSLLQIENEFYSAVRPKRTAQKGETALTALCRRGVEYIEVRCLDLDPFASVGVSEQQIRFLDVFLLYCTLQTSPSCAPEESARLLRNQKRVVAQGRQPGLQLETPSGPPMPMKQWASELLMALKPVAELLDHCHGGEDYQAALQTQQSKVLDPELTPSAQVLKQLKEQKISFAQWAKAMAMTQKNAYLETPLGVAAERKLSDMAQESLAIQREEENTPQLPFDQYLVAYYEQYSACRQPGPSVQP